MSAVVVPPTPASEPGSRAADKSARQLRRYLRFLRIYSLTVARVLRYRAHPEALAASEDPSAIADRIEDGLARQARRYRAVTSYIVALLLAPPLLAAFLWSAMYWLPVRIYWWPFARGNYGLPFLSLFEWLCYLGLAAYFVVAGAQLAGSHTETMMLGTEYRRLLELPDDGREQMASAIGDGDHPRTRFLVERSPVFADFAVRLAEKDAE